MTGVRGTEAFNNTSFAFLISSSSPCVPDGWAVPVGRFILWSKCSCYSMSVTTWSEKLLSTDFGGLKLRRCWFFCFLGGGVVCVCEWKEEQPVQSICRSGWVGWFGWGFMWHGLNAPRYQNGMMYETKWIEGGERGPNRAVFSIRGNGHSGIWRAGGWVVVGKFLGVDSRELGTAMVVLGFPAISIRQITPG